MNSEAKNLTRITGAAGGTGLAVGTDNDWLQIIGIVVAALSTILPIIERLLARKKDGPTALLAVLFAIGLATAGCGTTVNTATDGDVVSGWATNDHFTVTGGYNTETGDWSAGILVTFKAPPDAAVREALGEAGASPVVVDRSGKIVAVGTRGPVALAYVLPDYDRLNASHTFALELALRAGAVLTQAQ